MLGQCQTGSGKQQQNQVHVNVNSGTTRCHIWDTLLEMAFEVKPDSEKVKAVVEYPRPIMKTHIRSFLGLAGYYRNFVPNFAEIASPVTDLTKKSAPVSVVWNGECVQAFQLLKQTLVSVPVLNSPDFSKDFELQTDALN